VRKVSRRKIYRETSPETRLCVACGEPILRNLYIDKDGNLYHYGCYASERKKRFKCTECLGECNGLEAPRDWNQPRAPRTCPHCGSIGTLKNLWWWKKQKMLEA
jgi:ribosomal protein L32